MRRSRVLDGRENRRCRAKQRRRNDRVPVNELGHLAVEFEGRLAEHWPEPTSVGGLERLDLSAYLERSADRRLPPAEARRLAIHFESAAIGEAKRRATS